MKSKMLQPGGERCWPEGQSLRKWGGVVFMQKLRFFLKRSIYGLIIKSAPFFSDLKNLLETKNNNRFYILDLFFLLHGNQFSCPVTSLVNVLLQSWCILFKIRKIHVFGQISAFFCLVSIERGRGQEKYFHGWRIYDRFIHSQSIKLVHDLALY